MKVSSPFKLIDQKNGMEIGNRAMMEKALDGDNLGAMKIHASIDSLEQVAL